MNSAYENYAKQQQKREKAERRKRNGGPVMQIMVFLAGAAAAVYCLCSFVATQADIAEKKQELAALQEKAAELEIENAEYASILAEDDERTYMERIAVDVLGYAYPNERRFYDTTRN
jgi:cell division protein FtsB